MDEFFDRRLSINGSNYKSSLERIIDKYSKLQYQEGGVEVDLDSTKPRALERYMKLSRAEISKLESKSLTDLREESIRVQDITRDSQLDFTYQDGGADETDVSSTRLSVQDEGNSTDDSTHLTVSSLDESQRNVSVTEVQPEDQDEELEMSLRSHGSSLVELYPSMISRIGRAWRRRHVSEAAGSVLRRYRRWRQQPGRSNLGNTFVVTLRHTGRDPENETSRTLLEESRNSPGKRSFMGNDSTLRSPLRMLHNAQQQSPRRTHREQHQPVLVMDFSGPSETFMPRESSLNETFTVSEASRLGEQPSTCTFSPSRLFQLAARAPTDPSLRSRRLSLPSHSLQTDLCSTYASETSRERPDIYGSPVRQSPSRARMLSGLSRSPHGFSRSPKTYSGESLSRVSPRPRLISTPPQKPAVPLRMLHPQDSHHHLHPQLRSPHSAAAEGRHGLRRHLSFDSSLPSFRVSYSPKKLDEDFLKLYHKFVCQSKSSFFNGLHCRLCARSSDTSRGPSSSSSSSSSLAALALSPHRSLLRKRHRELDWDSHPQSKRYRDESCQSSPGSKRHGTEMLRRCLSPSEYGLSYSSRKPNMFERFNMQQQQQQQQQQQRSADSHQETWMSRHSHVSAADYSGMGRSLESRMAHGSSPRKW
ncbi:uncharacterized protein si:dkeyp-117h8.4 [Anoplopoma fimbria]|uniref:uncharacterized protein si:dkeyp-117h8.4 n=1 Tax=Anoplopoma fimbria TaxID=229290 RepID=UPI0023EDF942|nr:uncharacterized protein si:dkeyp-117h8.4 [Anoplopoma fimbria]